MDIIYGIDLGTSNCLAAEYEDVFGHKEVSCLKDDQRNTSFPSVINFTEEGKVIGKKARKLLATQPDSTIELVKIRMGQIKKEIEIMEGEKKVYYSPQELSAFFLDHFNKLHQDKIRKAVVTVPAYFDQSQRHATLQAGEIANINIVELIDEPAAAIMYHLFDYYKKNGHMDFDSANSKNYFVFDFGGGTLDLSLIKMEFDADGNVKPSVLIKEGDSKIGGNLIDFKFTGYIIELLLAEVNDKFINQVAEEFFYYQENLRFRSQTSEEVKKYIMGLKENLEFAKIQLSSNEETRVETLRNYPNYTIDQEIFEIDIMREYFRIPIEQSLQSFKEKVSKKNYSIDEVLLVGGSSQIPYIKRIIEDKFSWLKNYIHSSTEYDNAIAKGAAIFAAILNGEEVEPFGKNRFYNIVAHDMFIVQGNTERLLVENGTPYPFENNIIKKFEIGHALDKSINIKVKEKYSMYSKRSGERNIEEPIISDINFYHPFFYKNEKMEVDFQIDEKGIFSFKARHGLTNESVDFKADIKNELKENEINDARDKLNRNL